ncbi:MAG: ASCH domain-containing protein [Butyrivibrio sp.]|nr:ASCH domain-containing protein [Butyrivibrio sp.]
MNADEMWKKSGLKGDYEAWAFGKSADELAELVLNGTKTATCSVFTLYEVEGEELPKEGELSIVLDSKDNAVCIIQTTKVYVTSFKDVSEEHAFKEGEGDKSLKYWRDVHTEFFTEELKEIEQDFNSDMKVVCEEFEVVYK